MVEPRKKKAAHDMFSPKIAEKRRARKEAAKSGASVPATIDNYTANKPRVARSLNIQPVVAERRKTSPTEGMPAVNGKSGKELVKKAVTKVRPKTPYVSLEGVGITKGMSKKDAAKQKTKRASKSRTSKS